MALDEVFLAGHVTAGATALLLGPVAFLIGRGPDQPIALAYQVAVAAVALSAVVLAALEFTQLWWLIVLAVGTEGLALGGLYLATGNTRGARVLRAHLLGGSYIALVTALLVVSWDSPLAWVLPSASLRSDRWPDSFLATTRGSGEGLGWLSAAAHPRFSLETETLECSAAAPGS